MEAEPFVWAIAKTMVRSLFLAGHSIVIVDATNTTKKRRDDWKGPWCRRYRVMGTTVKECLRRAQSEGDTEIIPVIDRMAHQYEPVEDDEVDDNGGG